MTDETIFAAALEHPSPAERSAYLDSACPDPEQRKRIEGLLAAHDRAAGFLERPAVGPVPETEAETTRAFHTPEPEAADGPTRTLGEDADDTDEAIGFLAPAGRPDSLGRIGHYEVLEVLGKGGFGIVFRAFDEVLQRVVAVKVLAPSMAATSPARKRFLREARSSAAVRHENVVQIHDIQEHPLPHLVMEFVPGETLQQRLDRTGPLDVPEVLRIGRQVAEGLAAAHEQGLIHRDIKPSNILIDSGPQQRVKITDFGLARAADDASLTRSGVVAGTPMYMAPEQAKGESLDHRADLFSLGSVLYAMCSGRPPFRASTTLAVLKRVAEDTPRPIREIIPEVPAWLCRVVEKLHAKDPAERFQTAREVAELLADCEQQLKTHGALKDYSRIPGGKPTASQWTLPRPVVAAAAVLLPVAFILLLRSESSAAGRAASAFVGVLVSVVAVGAAQQLGRSGATGAAASGRLRVPAWAALACATAGTLAAAAVLGVSDLFDEMWMFLVAPPLAATLLSLVPWPPSGTRVSEASPRARGRKVVEWVAAAALLVVIGVSLAWWRGWVNEFFAPGPRVEDAPRAGSGGTPSAPPPVNLARWGSFINPQATPSIVLEPRAATFRVPGDRPYDLLPVAGYNHDAPRLVRAFEGDFLAEVTVAPFPVPAAGSAVPERQFSYVGAGLLVWVDERNLLRFERGGLGESEQGLPYLHGEWYSGGERRGDVPKPVAGHPDAPLRLQVERRGSTLHLRWRQDGPDWQDWQTVHDIDLPARVSVGLVAINTTRQEFSPRFENLAVRGTPLADPLQSRHGQELAGWGTVVDPKRDCGVQENAGVLTVTVPAGKHNLNPTPGFNDISAPRVLRDVTGNFRLTARVEAFPPPATGNPDIHQSYQGAGLVLWQDDKNFVRFLRAANGATGKEFIHFEAFRDGRVAGGLSLNIPSAPVVLRVDRAGQDFRFWFSTDGENFTEFIVKTPVRLGETLAVGVCALNSTSVPFAARFSGFECDPGPGADGWVQLFNGKDLSGWKTHPDWPVAWRVEGGRLIGPPTRSHLFTERGDFADFHLRAEVLLPKSGNSGLYFRSSFALTNTGWPAGHEIQIYNGEGPASDPFKTGSLHNVKESPPGVVVGPGWFTLEVIARGTRLTTRVEGKTVFDGELPATDSRTRRSGHFALQAIPGAQVAFRKVEIKELLPEPSAGPKPPPAAVAPFDAAKAKERQEAWAKHLGVPAETDGPLGMKLALIPPGEFWIGSSPEEVKDLVAEVKRNGGGDVWSDQVLAESPAQRVRLTRPWQVGTREVTVAQFRRFVDATGYKTDAERANKDGATPKDDENWFRDPNRSWLQPGPWVRDDAHPVLCVSWNDAAAFCKWLGESSGRPCRLPTEAEWEFACRAGSERRYSFGADPFLQADYAVFGSQTPSRVGTKKANAFGLFDMEGNAWEWCSGRYGTGHGTVPLTDPQGPDGNDVRVIRGGAYISPAFASRCASRWGYAAHHRDPGIGFRVAFELAPPAKAPATTAAPFTDPDVKRIAALPAEEQLKAVAEELKKRNPLFDGSLKGYYEPEPKIDASGVVTALSLATDHVTDISPLRALTGLKKLKASPADGDGRLIDLSPLAGLPLSDLRVYRNLGLKDLTPLKGMILTTLDVTGTAVESIEVARGMPLRWVWVDSTRVSDLSPLTGLTLSSLHCSRCEVRTLKGLPVKSVESLTCTLSQLPDEDELKRLGVEELGIDTYDVEADAPRLRALGPRLKWINAKPAEEVLKKLGKQPANPPGPEVGPPPRVKP